MKKTVNKKGAILLVLSLFLTNFPAAGMCKKKAHLIEIKAQNFKEAINKHQELVKGTRIQTKADGLAVVQEDIQHSRVRWVTLSQLQENETKQTSTTFMCPLSAKDKKNFLYTGIQPVKKTSLTMWGLVLTCVASPYTQVGLSALCGYYYCCSAMQ